MEEPVGLQSIVIHLPEAIQDLALEPLRARVELMHGAGGTEVPECRGAAFFSVYGYPPKETGRMEMYSPVIPLMM